MLWPMAHIEGMQHARDRLREWIVRSKLSQGKAADLLGVDRSYLSQVLSGKRSLGIKNAVHFEALTGVPVEAWVSHEVGGPSEPVSATVANSPGGNE